MTNALHRTALSSRTRHRRAELGGERGQHPHRRRDERRSGNALRRGQQLSGGARGVTAVADEITVRSSYTVNDTDLVRELSEALERSVDLPAEVVKATVHDHVPTLDGQSRGSTDVKLPPAQSAICAASRTSSA